MKRIAAVAALIVAMLAIPAAAMASTGGSGIDGPGQGQYYCPQPYLHHHHYHHSRHHHGNRHRRHHGHHGYGQPGCYYPGPPLSPQICQGQSFVFDMAPGSNSFFEVSGPTLVAGEQFTYNGYLFTIGTADPIASSYTDTSPNFGPNIVNGTGYLCPS